MNPVDKHIGNRVRVLRQSRGLTQRNLGEHLGVRFQQIQKYESGQNRISAAQLFAIAEFLGVGVDHFFQDMEFEGGKPAKAQENPLTLAQNRELTRIFAKLDTSQRDAVMAFLRSLARTDETV
ncbi:helix-turn-helix domain-containing protein [Roseivivax isoporae]|uniref:Cro/Cl family transcriptional regulator n=1 Tax=Roseivivax isoporae LMG 25204 TaxID=1449351 RepID=X7FD51_9RHOB|nr:helix-turn-helix transcriptional regulator [Roseivivax isoporae]ETX30668.1 Cro/Cl family transcriptional regulator [Roseivivax isoporae LMG 25204]